MAGAIIENMSTKKLCIVGGALLAFQVVAFLVGGLIGKDRRAKFVPAGIVQPLCARRPRRDEGPGKFVGLVCDLCEEEEGGGV